MRLYNIILGNQKIASGKWAHITDEHGNHFIAKDDIRQRMRIDKGVDSKLYPKEGELVPEWSSANIQCYNILPNTRWVNNNKNMNPLLLMNNKENEEDDQMVVFLTVASNYSIIHFNTEHRILQTYHKKDVLQGCAIVLRTRELDECKELIVMKVYDQKKDQYIRFTIKVTDKDKTKIITERKQITDKKELYSMRGHIQKFKNRLMGFKIITKPGDTLTLLYITNKENEMLVREKTKGIRNLFVLSVEQSDIGDEYYGEDFYLTLLDYVVKNRIRSVTTCGIRIPLDLIKKLKLLYVFDYDDNTEKLICKKSN